MTGFKEAGETTARQWADSPLAKISEGKTFVKPMSEYDKLLDPCPNDHFPVDKPDGMVIVYSEKADVKGEVYTDENGQLLPNTEYILNGNVYKTDDKGRIISCDAIPKKTPDNTRDTDAQKTAGGSDRKSGDQGGHIVGRDMGGDAGEGNLIPMDSRINQSDYKRMENEIKKALEEGKNVSAKTEIEYEGDSDRPSKIITTVTVDGKDTVYTFDNDLNGSLMDKMEETCSESDLDTIQDVLDETGGEISSVKEEYDADGNLEKTTVTVTYTGDDGKNYRSQIVIDHTGGASA